MDFNTFTPIEKRGNLFFKRDDLFDFKGIKGAKARATTLLFLDAKEKGYNTVSAMGPKTSIQLNIAAKIAKELDMKLVGHTSTAPLQPEMIKAKENGAEIIQHSPGYNSVLIRRAKDYAIDNGAYYLPFGLEDMIAINATKNQVKSLLPYKDDIKRIVVPVGSGTNFIGVVLGAMELKLNIPIIGIKIGANPKKVLEKYLGKDYTNYLTLLEAEQPYDSNSIYNEVNGVKVDSTYEGKCIPFLEEGDLLWLIAKKDIEVEGKSINI